MAKKRINWKGMADDEARIAYCVKEASKFATRGEWYEGSKATHGKACREGWLDIVAERAGLECVQTNWEGMADDEARIAYCVEEASKFTTRTEWQKGSNSTYLKARDEGWSEIVAERAGLEAVLINWAGMADDEARIAYCVEEASKFTTRRDWYEGSNATYQKACEKGWLDIVAERAGLEAVLINWEGMADDEARIAYCVEEASKFTTRRDWYEGSNATYQKACEKGWLDIVAERAGLEAVLINWEGMADDETRIAYCVEEASKFTTRTEWHGGSHATYSKANKEGWLDNVAERAGLAAVAVRINWKGMADDEARIAYCVEEASKFTTRGEWNKGSPKTYEKASQKGWLDIVAERAGLEVVRINWEGFADDEARIAHCVEEASKFTTRTEWYGGSPKTYQKALREGWLDIVAERAGLAAVAEQINWKGMWEGMADDEARIAYCVEEASKFTTRTEWQQGSQGTYKKACKEGWLDIVAERAGLEENPESLMERWAASLANELGIDCRKQWTGHGLKAGSKRPLKADLVVMRDGSPALWVEFMGRQHYEVVPYFHRNGYADLVKQQRRDQDKRDWCSRNGVPYAEIKYTKRDEGREAFCDELLGHLDLFGLNR